MGGEIDIDVPSGGQLTFKLPSVAGYAEPSVGKRSLVFGEQSSLTIGFARCGHLSKRFLHAEIFEHLPTLFHGLRRQDGEASSLEKRSGGKARFGAKGASNVREPGRARAALPGVVLAVFLLRAIAPGKPSWSADV